MYRSLLILSTLAALLCAAPAAHAIGWATTPPLSDPGRIAADPQIAVTPGGETVVAWRQTTPAGVPENVSVRTAPAGGDFGPAQTLDGAAGALELTAGADGTVALAWVDFRTRTVNIARRAPGEAAFTRATPLAAPMESIGGLQLAVSQGDAYVAFSSFIQGMNSASSVWLARLGAGGNAVQVVPGTAAAGAVDNVSFTAPAAQVFVQFPVLAVDDGRATVSWVHQTVGVGNGRGTATVRVARGGAGGVGVPAPLATLVGRSTDVPDTRPVAAAGAGQTYVLWSSGDIVVYANLAEPGLVRQIPADTDFDRNLQAGVDASGSLVAAWEGDRRGVGNSVVTGVIAAPGQAPPPAVHLTPAGADRALDDLAVAADGSALALPTHNPGSNATTLRVDGALRPAGGTFGPVEDITGLRDVRRFQFDDAAAAVAPGGRALAAWTAADPAGTVDQRLYVSERDTAPPVVGAIAVPATATVGEPAGFAAVAGDVLSGTTISWDFGDGSQADGGVVSHVFGAPGAAIVTITATDEHGNSTSEQRVVAVQAAPAGGGGVDPPAVDRTAPVVTRASVSNRRFRVARKGTTQIAGSSRKRSPAGTALRLTLSERSTLAVAIERRGIVRGTLVRASAGPGRVTIPFTGRVGRTALPAASYLATITAIDGTGNRSKRVRVKFTVVKR